MNIFVRLRIAASLLVLSAVLASVALAAMTGEATRSGRSWCPRPYT